MGRFTSGALRGALSVLAAASFGCGAGGADASATMQSARSGVNVAPGAAGSPIASTLHAGSGGQSAFSGNAGLGAVAPNASAGRGGAAGDAVAGTAGRIGADGAGTGGSAGGTSHVSAGAGTGGSEHAAGPCTGKPGHSGDVTRTWDKEGASYITHYPAGLDANTPVPLVFVAHGFTMSGAVMQQLTGFDAVADAHKFVVVYPDGDGGATPWNVGDNTCAPGSLVDAAGADSFGYLDAMRAAVEMDQCINPKQIFITGFSMGGYFSHNVGCQRGNELVRAAGPHSGGTYPGDCPGAPLPIFIMHGDADTFIDYMACGMGARDYWLMRNKCGTQFDTKPVMGGSCDWYKDCDRNGQTVFCSFNGVGHAWAGGATDAVWNFFQMYL